MKASILRALVAAGATADMLIAAVEADEAEANARAVDRRGILPRHDLAPCTPRPSERDCLALKAHILQRDGFMCVYCGYAGEAMCADHVVPLSRGGSNHPDNLVACCLPCNSSKSDRLLSEWRGRYR